MKAQVIKVTHDDLVDTTEVLKAFRQLASEQGLDPAYVGRYQPITVMMHRSWDKFLSEGL